MPRSRRDRVVALTQTAKKGKEAKGKLIEEIREQADAFQYLWVFDVEHMRNNLLQEVRKAWKGSRSVPLSLFYASILESVRPTRLGNGIDPHALSAGSSSDGTPSCARLSAQLRRTSADSAFTRRPT